MKKIIAISVMFALVAGAVFADVSMGGDFGYKWDVLKGDNGKVYSTSVDPKVPAGADAGGVPPLGYPNPVKSGTSFVSARVDFNFSGDNYGGKVRLYAAGSQGWWGSNPFAFVWWKPVDIFQFQLGHNPDGNWGAAQITGWGFNASAQDFVAVDNDANPNTTWTERGTVTPAGTGVAVPTTATWQQWQDFLDALAKAAPSGSPFKGGQRERAWRSARSYGFYGGFSDVGALLSFYPVDILTVNIALPVNAGHNAGTIDAEDLFKKAHLNVVAKVGDIGTARLSFVGGGGTKTTKDFGTVAGENVVVSKKTYASTGDIYASFYLTAIENLGVDFGVGYHLPFDTPSGTGASLSTKTTDKGIDVGVGVRYTVSDDLGVKVRVGAKLLAEEKTVTAGGYSSTAQTNYGLGILPYFNLGGPTVYFNAGFGIDSYEQKAVVIGSGSASRSYSYTDWYVNPYVKVPAGGLTFWAGFKVLGDTKLGYVKSSATQIGTAKQNGATMEWAIPIGISVGF